MALIKCQKCFSQFSDQAPTCPHCGAPSKMIPSVVVGGSTNSPEPGKAVGIILAVAFAGWIVWTSEKNDTACATGDLQCAGNNAVVAAGVYCKAPIEKLAIHSVRWTDETLEGKFSRFRWLDKSNGTLTMVGDKAEFQNGFGAYTPVIYECDFGADGKTVLDVRVIREGRLP